MHSVRRGPSTADIGQNEQRAGAIFRHTVVDATGDETGEREHGIEDSVRRVGEGDILRTSGTQVRDGTEHADGGEAGYIP